MDKHAETHAGITQNSQYGGGNMFYDEYQYPVYTMSTTGLNNIAESTRLETQETKEIHKYKCEKCAYMNELIMHVNTKHWGDCVNIAESTLINVAVVDDNVDVIVDMLKRKRKYADNCNRSNVIIMKYKLYG